jgi:hypothetical protein
MTLFLDCEFNGFGGELISIALVSDKGDPKHSEFYAALPLPKKIDPWVAEHVVPIILIDPIERGVLMLRIRSFLEKHSGEPVVADWPEDHMHLLSLLCAPGGMAWAGELDLRYVQSGKLESRVPHNALSDARALRTWYTGERGSPFRPIVSNGPNPHRAVR